MPKEIKREMSLDKFIDLNQQERAEYLYEHGVFLASSPERGNLYSVGDFFVELVYNSEENCIQEINWFRSRSQLAPYLAYIDLLKL